METRTPRVAGQLQRLGHGETGERDPLAPATKTMAHSRNFSVAQTEVGASNRLTGARGSVGLPTGASSGEGLTSSGPIGNKRKASMAPARAGDLFRDPSVQMDPLSNYIESKAQLPPRGSAQGSGVINNAFNTAQSDNTAHLKKIHRSELLPAIGTSRRLMQLEGDGVLAAANPFKVAAGTERALALGERSREADKLAKLKFQLVQREAEGADYLANMSRKRLNLKEDRTAVLGEIRQIPAAVSFLAPHMDFSTRKPRHSPSPSDTLGAEQAGLALQLRTPATTRHKSVAKTRNGPGSTLLPIAESIANQISPLRGAAGQDLD